MRPIVGIITRPVYSDENHLMYGVYEDMCTAVALAGGIPIGILPSQNIEKELLKTVDGLIFQGGDDFTNYERELLLLAHQQNIKTLGICLGMQLMGTCFDGSMVDVTGHKKKKKEHVHSVTIATDSTLSKIFESDVIITNSRHKSALLNTSLDIIGRSQDGVIEAIEDKKKDFFVGVQWHPESMVAYDILQKQLFTYFVEKCRK